MLESFPKVILEAGTKQLDNCKESGCYLSFSSSLLLKLLKLQRWCAPIATIGQMVSGWFGVTTMLRTPTSKFSVHVWHGCLFFFFCQKCRVRNPTLKAFYINADGNGVDESDADSDDWEWQQVRADNQRSASPAASSGESPIYRQPSRKRRRIEEQ